ncbi:kinase-like domain-containing protein [Umbelopsis sp. AD052]|nr:kinase-like domain-containing protein [Umbelopsis sp. AD052]
MKQPPLQLRPSLSTSAASPARLKPSLKSSNGSPYYAQTIEPGVRYHDERSKQAALIKKAAKHRSLPAQLPHTGFKKVINKAIDLRPVVHRQPAYRRARPEGGFISPLQALTIDISESYRLRNPVYKYNPIRNPRRVLTKPSKPSKNDGFDNEDCDYILKVNDTLGNEKGQEYVYRVLDILGQGTFGQVVKCQRISTKELVSVKVIKNKPAYMGQSQLEVEILKKLNGERDAQDRHHILRLYHTFIHRNHLCLVFELLSVNLYELIKQNSFKGLSTNLVRVISHQLVDALVILKDAEIIHCDLKPENILLKNLDSPTIKIIDFGSACHESHQIYTYIQSRFYRSPEVLFGVKYNSAIDMWSLGCIVAELFLGLPLFPGCSEYNQVSRIVDMLGMPPTYMLENGKTAREFFVRKEKPDGRRIWTMKTREEYSREYVKAEPPGKKYFNETKLTPLILNYNQARHGLDEGEKERERQSRHALIDFIQGLLNQDPIRRWTPHQIRNHPFLTGKPFTGPFEPDVVPSFVKNPMARRSLEPLMNKTSNSNMMMGPPRPAPLGAMMQDLPPGPPPVMNYGGPINAVPPPMVVPTAQQPLPMVSQALPRRQRAKTVGNSKIPPQIQMILSDIKQYPVEEHKRSKVDSDVVANPMTYDIPTEGPLLPPLNLNEGTSKSIAQQPTTQHFGHRRTRSQGNLAGVLPADSPSIRYKRRSGVQQSAMDSSFSTSSDDELRGGATETRGRVSEKHTTYGQDSMDGHLQRDESGSGSSSRNDSQNTSPATSLAAALDKKVKIASKVKVRIGSRDSFRMPADVRRGAALLENPTANKNLMRGYSAGEAAGGLMMMRTSSAEGGKGASKSTSTSKKRSGSEKTGGMMT